jgi:hypothetical protein
MKCLATFSENSLYKIKLSKARKNVLETMYRKPCIVEVYPIKDNLRLRLRFKEAIQEAQEICENNHDARECHLAWYEVDELDDAMQRICLDRW